MHNPHLITVVQLMPSPAPTGGGLVLGTDGEGFGVVGFCLGLIRRALVCRALPGAPAPGSPLLSCATPEPSLPFPHTLLRLAVLGSSCRAWGRQAGSPLPLSRAAAKKLFVRSQGSGGWWSPALPAAIWQLQGLPGTAPSKSS